MCLVHAVLIGSGNGVLYGDAMCTVLYDVQCSCCCDVMECVYDVQI